jgi:hypothetical protein
MPSQRIHYPFPGNGFEHKNCISHTPDITALQVTSGLQFTRQVFTGRLLVLFCTPQAYCLLASAAYYNCLGILHTYIDAARTRITENTCHIFAIQSINWRAG